VKMGKSLDFGVVVIDHSPVLSEQPDELIKDIDYDLGKFPCASADSVVVLTRGERDVGTLAALSKVKLRYVGMLGSRQRIREDLAKLREAGVGEQFIASLRAPIGADIGAVTATEIALSILSEIVAAKYGKEVLRKALVEGKPNEIPS